MAWGERTAIRYRFNWSPGNTDSTLSLTFPQTSDVTASNGFHSHHVPWPQPCFCLLMEGGRRRSLPEGGAVCPGFREAKACWTEISGLEYLSLCL